MIHAGTNDVSDERDTKHIVHHIAMLIKTSKSLGVANQVVVSSLCPRKDNTTASEKSNAVNRDIESLCEKENCVFVNHDLSMMYRDGSVDPLILQNDNLYLTDEGTHRLIRNIDCQAGLDIFSDTTKSTQRRPPASQKPHKKEVETAAKKETPFI